jgi:tRNA (guanine37-N1)-methyltransferase
MSFSPQGRPITQELLQELTAEEHLVLLCGRYAGIDERLVYEMVNLEVSAGDFVLSGGEPAALLVIDALSRLKPHVLGNETSARDDSFSLESVFEAPLFTRPAEWRGLKVPEALTSGHHQNIETFRRLVGVARVMNRRPDLAAQLPEKLKTEAARYVAELDPSERRLLGLS